MSRGIDQFMWAYQHTFRTGVEYGVKAALEAIGAPMDVRVLLVGYRVDATRRHAICIEPENARLTQEHLAGVLIRAQEVYAADPESQITHSNRDLHDRRQAWNRRHARADATVEAIEASETHAGYRFYGSASAPIGGYEVHSLIGVPQERIDALPAFEDHIHDRIHVGQSLAHEVICECLRRADQALYLPDPGMGIRSLGAPTSVIVRAAAETLIDGCAFRADDQPGDLADRLDRISAAAYERAAAHGRILLANAAHPDIRAHVRLARPVSLRDTRAARKLLETTDDRIALLANGREVFAIGEIEPSDDPTHPEHFEIVVIGPATWELRHRATSLMRIAYGQAALPRPLLDRSAFEDSVTRRIGDADTEALWAYVDAVAASDHGTTLVISADAAAEAQRLSGQATVVDVTQPSTEDVARLARIDGALLFDPSGNCHAIGVILDGVADGTGDRARGSRYNSAVRYTLSATPSTVAIVVSEDGTIDLIPSLEPRITRAELQRALEEFRGAATSDPVNGERFARAVEVIDGYRFYLSQEQCDEANALYDAEQDRRLRDGGIALRRQPLTPNPLMNDSYFLPET